MRSCRRPLLGFGRFALDLVPAPGQGADPRVDDQLIGGRQGQGPLAEAERGTGDEVQVREPVTPTTGAIRLPSQANPTARGHTRERDPGQEPGDARKPGIARSEFVLDDHGQGGGASALVLQDVVDRQRLVGKDVGAGHGVRSRARRIIAALMKIDAAIGPAASPAVSNTRLLCW